MTLGHAALVAGASLAAGAMNAIAGGGSFLTFPALVFAGVAPIPANATSAVALWPGTLASVLAYRRELGQDRALTLWLAAASLFGGGAGAALLVLTPPATFMRLVPFLLLAATLLFTFGPRLTRARAGGGGRAHPAVAVLLQLLIATYGGYFGGGIGMMMLAAFSVMGMTDIHRMNALKNLLAAALNGVAVVTFIAVGVVEWGPAAIMLVGAVAGGYAAAAVARRTRPERVRALVVVIGWSMTAYFFVR